GALAQVPGVAGCVVVGAFGWAARLSGRWLGAWLLAWPLTHLVPGLPWLEQRRR
ncbi:MAG: hypothetical protein RL442_1685, partial [Pseudomonadota bacterium]